jgi:hypothetical protein
LAANLVGFGERALALLERARRRPPRLLLVGNRADAGGFAKRR